MYIKGSKAKIIGTGSYVPPKVVTNFDLESVMDTSDEWIRQRSGIERRRVVEGVGTVELATEATLKAIKAAKIQVHELDLVIVATLSPDLQFPGTSALLQHRLGLSTTPSMDIRCQCSGFIYALNVGKLFIESGQYRTVLVVGAEAHSPVLDFTTRGRDVSVLFGDGAGAVILQASGDGSGIDSIALHSQGQYSDRLLLEKPGTSGGKWITIDDIESGRIYPKMDGKYVFKHAVERLQECVREVVAMENMSISDVDHFLFHQANIRINEKVAELLSIPNEKIHSNIQKYGNCSAASIPILLDEVINEGKIHAGQRLVLAAFGAGFTWGAAVVTV